ncbi:MAG: rhamnosyltransferase [Rhodoferax sp.]|nr:rhamnosyltransferase [Rhodoferax sp.]
MSINKKFAVTVAYLPDLELLEKQFQSLRPQIDSMVLLHNGPSPVGLENLCTEYSVEFLPIESNIGLAHAQNQGIEYAASLGATEILLMDQDSIPYPLMVSLLSQALASHPDAAAAGPRSIDLRSGHKSRFLMDDGAVIKVFDPGNEASVATLNVAHLIASGTLLRTSALSSVGLMRGEWFIDHIDTEWCFRARLNGWKIIAVTDAYLGHSLGDKVSRVWWGRIRQISHHSPLRHYYMFRNTVFLVNLSYVPSYWKIFHLKRLMQIFLYFVVLAPQRLLRTKMILRGLFDGVRNIAGKKTVSHP